MSATTTDKRAARAARRGELDGSGPVREERAPARFPGASAKFALFGEVMLVGVLVALGGILLVTLPAALVAGTRHLRRFVAAEGSPMSAFWADYRRALPGGIGVGAASVLLAAVLVLDIAVAGSGALRGVPTRIAHDPVAALYVAVAAGLTGVVTWMLFLLLVPALGCAVLAAVAAPHRRGR